LRPVAASLHSSIATFVALGNGKAQTKAQVQQKLRHWQGDDECPKCPRPKCDAPAHAGILPAVAWEREGEELELDGMSGLAT
jgi:hypothetical protein